MFFFLVSSLILMFLHFNGKNLTRTEYNCMLLIYMQMCQTCLKSLLNAFNVPVHTFQLVEHHLVAIRCNCSFYSHSYLKRIFSPSLYTFYRNLLLLVVNPLSLKQRNTAPYSDVLQGQKIRLLEAEIESQSFNFQYEI